MQPADMVIYFFTVLLFILCTGLFVAAAVGFVMDLYKFVSANFAPAIKAPAIKEHNNAQNV